MTALIACKGEHEVFLAADGKQGAEQHALKTVKFNDAVAVGFSGEIAYANYVAAVLFRRPEWYCLDALREIERNKISYPGICFSRVRHMLHGILDRVDRMILNVYPKVEDQLGGGLGVILVGVSGWEPEMWCKARESRGIFREAAPIDGAFNFGPQGEDLGSDSHRALRDESLSAEDRIMKAIECHAKADPRSVNRNVALRRATHFFELEPSDWLGRGISNSEEQAPST